MMQVEKNTLFTFKFRGPSGMELAFAVAAPSQEEALKKLSADIAFIQVEIEKELTQTRSMVA